jgi:hypothetical protein
MFALTANTFLTSLNSIILFAAGAWAMHIGRKYGAQDNAHPSSPPATPAQANAAPPAA